MLVHARTHTHRNTHTKQMWSSYLFTHTKTESGKAPSALPASVTVHVKGPQISKFINTRGASICFQSTYVAKCAFAFWRHAPTQCRQITKKERGRNWRLKPLISLEKVCTLLGGPAWPFADNTGAAETGAVDKWDIRIHQQVGMEVNTDSQEWIITVSMCSESNIQGN